MWSETSLKTHSSANVNGTPLEWTLNRSAESRDANPQGFPAKFWENLPRSRELESAFNTMMARRQQAMQKIMKGGQEVEKQIKENQNTLSTIYPPRIRTWVEQQQKESKK